MRDTTNVTWRVHPELDRKIRACARERGLSLYELLQEIALEYVIWCREHHAPDPNGFELWMAPRKGDTLQAFLLTELKDELTSLAPEYYGVDIQYTALIHYARRHGWLEELPDSSPELPGEVVLDGRAPSLVSHIWMHQELEQRFEERLAIHTGTKKEYMNALVRDWLQMRRPIKRLFFEYPSTPQGGSPNAVRHSCHVDRELHAEIKCWARHDYVTASHTYRAALVYHLERD